MFNWIQHVMENGYAYEHGHKLHGAAAIAHFMNRPVNSISQTEINAGARFVQTLFNK